MGFFKEQEIETASSLFSTLQRRKKICSAETQLSFFDVAAQATQALVQVHEEKKSRGEASSRALAELVERVRLSQEHLQQVRRRENRSRLFRHVG
jgi:hypothetical protein